MAKTFELTVADGMLTNINPFERVMRAFKPMGEAAAPAEETKRPTLYRPPVWEDAPVQMILNWLQKEWTEDTISLRELCRHGPRRFRDQRNTMLEAAEVLVAHGWLVPDDDVRASNILKWRIVRRTSKGKWNLALAQLPPSDTVTGDIPQT